MGDDVVDVEGFEGPLDLLLSLARNQKVDLAKISILALADQYLDHPYFETRAVAAGATIRTPVEDADWGDRIATIIDPFGHIWALASINREISVAEFNARGNVQLIEAA